MNAHEENIKLLMEIILGSVIKKFKYLIFKVMIKRGTINRVKYDHEKK